MLTSNTTERVRNPERRMVHMSLAEMRRHLYDGDLLSTIRETQKNNDVYVRLPIYCLYKEAITPTWPDETKAFSVTISESANLREAEKLSWRTFTRVHLEVAPRLSFTPDSCLVGAPYSANQAPAQSSMIPEEEEDDIEEENSAGDWEPPPTATSTIEMGQKVGVPIVYNTDIQAVHRQLPIIPNC
ncbi:hypothetical protein M8J76_009837 [Diaphorina citri]|nr:hypothetical protein M8J75_006054 [Diaphorina citri]KAI5733268.1 hypothetical protein M8J76_009837 [Diaphorina citri]